jgi:hypothetical protein
MGQRRIKATINEITVVMAFVIVAKGSVIN